MDATLLGQKPPTPTLKILYLKKKKMLKKMWFEIWKGRKKLSKRQIRTRVDRVKRSATHFTICVTKTDSCNLVS